MKVISQGNNTYDIFDNSLQVYEKLPAQSYVVRYSKGRGFHLSKYVDINVNEEKVYGVCNSKVEKVMKSFTEMNRSLGVILSGDKGIGKSLFTKVLSTEAISRGIPVIVVDTYINGIASYIESIEQEAMILFDEFDKTFGEVIARDGEASPQASLLSLFDGLSGEKKLFVITCNEYKNLNEYLINRPGRFHYHIRFEYPSAVEIRQYLKDKLAAKFQNEIDNVVAFANKVSLNYDCLRSIAFELNHGLTFAEAIKDLNIINIANESYDLVLRYENGITAVCNNETFDIFGNRSMVVNFRDSQTQIYFVNVLFTPTDGIYDSNIDSLIIPASELKLMYDYDDGAEPESQCNTLIKRAKSSTVKYLMIRKRTNKEIHYIL